MKWLPWIFQRRPKEMRSGMWRAGELAVCVSDSWNYRYANFPLKGDVLRVVGVEDSSHDGIRAIWLTFGGIPGFAFWSNAFRKAAADDKAADETFTAHFRRKSKRSGGQPVAAPLPRFDALAVGPAGVSVTGRSVEPSARGLQPEQQTP